MRVSQSRMSGVLFLMLACFGLRETVAADSRADVSPIKRPNVLLIYTDDHAQWAVGAYGNKEVHTPNIDRLSAEGMRFTRGFTKPVCSPSRAMLMSGQYSHRLGIPDYIPYGNPVVADNGLPPGTPTIASVLGRIGYKTALFGKWHIGYGEKYYPTRFGFDKAEGYRYVAPGKEGIKLGQMPYLVDGVERRDFGKTSDIATDCTTILADRAIDFIGSNRDKPFFVYLSFYRPHLPWSRVPPEDFAHYKNQPVTVTDPPAGCTATKEQLQEWMRLYYANITCADRNIGRVFDALDQLDLAKNTIVIFIGDNGFMVGQHALLGKGNARRLHADERGRISRDKGTRANMFNESVHVPFIVRWPGVVKPGSVNDALVSTIDVLPTLADTTGVDVPPCVDGRSLLPLLKEEPNVKWRDAYCDTYDMVYLGDNGEKPHMRMIYTGDWKLVLYEDETGNPLDGGGRHELFDLKGDPKELNNLYGKPTNAEVQQSLEKRLRTWMRETHVVKDRDAATTVDLHNNMKCVDLSDLTGELPLEVASSKQILWQTESWERSTWSADKGRESVGYPTMVRNDRGANPDKRYYLYYAHHDPNSGIGCAVAESVEGPYVKLAQIDKARPDSRALVCPGKPGQPFHYSSPCVVWNEQEQLWFMYFHFYENQWKTGGGHQRTALATCPDLAKNVWTPWVDQHGKLVPVFPVTAEPWMNSQSSYHAIQRLPDGRWLGFLRGTGGEYTAAGKWTQFPCKLGFATSTDGRHWDYFSENPVIHQDDGGGGRKGVYRPHFVGDLGNGEYLLCWSESNPYDGSAKIVYGYTRDFRTVVRDKRGYAHWPMSDGLISPWREGRHLYLFAGRYLHVMNLPVSR